MPTRVATYPEQLARPPYVHWTLDRWKLGLALILFMGLLVSGLTGPRGEVALPQADAPVPTLVQALNSGAGSAAATSDAVPTLASGDDGTDEQSVLLPNVPTPAESTLESAASMPLVLPLTLANLGPNAVVPAGSVRVLFGTAAAGTTVEVYDQFAGQVARSDLSPGAPVESQLGTTLVDRNGLWQLGPLEAFAAGQHVLTLRQLDAAGQLLRVSAPVVVTVLASGEQGPLSLATPTIRYPYVGARLLQGPLTFVGSGLPGMGVRLYLNNRLVAQGIISMREEWQLVPEEELPPGVYEARVTAVNPQGDIIAESAPVVFVVAQEPVAASLPMPLPSPSLPLTVSGLAFGDRRRQTLVVRGLASPHASIAAFLDGRAINCVNALIDGRWQLWLVNPRGFAANVTVELRTSLGERLVTDYQLQTPALVDAPQTPVVVEPRHGEILTTRRPLVVGLAQPTSEVAVIINSKLVARVRSDALGQWAYQLVDPLPAGATALTAGSGEGRMPPALAQPVFITVAPIL